MKLNRILSVLGLAATVAFASCSKDETTTPTPVAPKAVINYTAKLLQAPLAGDTTTGSNRVVFFSATNGSTVNFAAAAAGAATMDFGYFWGNTANATLASPDDYLTTVNSNFVGRRFSIKNQTRFRTVNATFSIIDRNGQIDTFFNAGTPTPVGTSGIGVAGSRATQLSAGNVLGMQFASGKKAILLVKDVQTGPGSLGSISFEIKVQAD